jgi:hypothetical protein
MSPPSIQLNPQHNRKASDNRSLKVRQDVPLIANRREGVTANVKGEEAKASICIVSSIQLASKQDTANNKDRKLKQSFKALKQGITHYK